MAITLTEKAAARVQTLLAKQGGVGLRVGLRKAGCSGMAYTFDIAPQAGADDQVFESHGAKVLVDRETLIFLDGAQLDYVRDGLNEMFRLRNPNEKAACGCGESVAF
ncbi:MAG: iron-sulfur cluster assembly accessory protein [Pseudomonadota bacterium]